MTTKEEALAQLEELKQKVEGLKQERDKIMAEVSMQAAEVKQLREEKAVFNGQLEKVQAELGRLRTVAKTYEQLELFFGSLIKSEVEDYFKEHSVSGNGGPSFSVEEAVAKVLERLPRGSGAGVVAAPPREALLKTFMRDEVSRLEERLNSLPSDVKRVIAFLQAKGSNSTKSDLITRVWGPGYTGGERYKDVSKIIDDAIATGLARKDTAGRIYSNIQLKVESDLKSYEPSKDEVQQVVDRVTYILAQGMEAKSE